MIRSEPLYQACKEYIFDNYWPKLQSLQAFINDGVTLEDFAKKSTLGLVLFNQDRYPILVLELADLTADEKDHFDLKFDLLVMLKSSKDEDLTQKRQLRYVDALLNLVADDITLGGICTRAVLDTVKFGKGREGDRDFVMFITALKIKE